MTTKEVEGLPVQLEDEFVVAWTTTIHLLVDALSAEEEAQLKGTDF